MLNKLSWKTSLVIEIEILELFLDTLTANGNYSRCNWENFLARIQMDLSKKPKFFSQVFMAFLKSPLNFKHFGEKDEPQRLIIPEII